MLLWAAVDREPQRQLHESNSTQQEEGRAPAPMHNNPRDNQGSSDGAKIGPSIKDTRSQCALFIRKPFRNRLQAGGKYGGLSKTQGRASHEKTRERSCQAMSQ